MRPYIVFQVDFYKNISLHRDAPVVWVGNMSRHKKPAYLPPELEYLTIDATVDRDVFKPLSAMHVKLGGVGEILPNAGPRGASLSRPRTDSSSPEGEAD